MEVDIGAIKGIGPARRAALEAAGIRTARDLVMLLPREYRDLTNTVSLEALQPGVFSALRVRITGEVRQQYARKLVITRAMVTDGTQVIPTVWYNQPWLKDQLMPGRELLLYGKPEWKKGVLTLVSPTIEQEGGIIPVYRAIAGIPAKSFRTLMERSLDALDSAWTDELPAAIREEYGLCERNFALRNAHFPMDRASLDAARRRIAFEELLLYQTALVESRGAKQKGVQLNFPNDALDQFWSRLSFAPTGAQRRVLMEIAEDLRQPYAMARMVQGDVGCGKTAIAFAAMALAYQCGYQSALMAPTEVLARQHYESALQVLSPLGCRVGLLTGSLTVKQHRTAHDALRMGEWDVVIGTHALITDQVEYARLGLVITDEQHRFGVTQRSKLGQKGASPNVLVMSATPIPRSLSLVLYGDLDISIVDELPPGRKPVSTRVVPESKRGDMLNFIRAEVKKGRQAYVVCPLVEESEAVEALSAEQIYEELRTSLLPDLRIALVHGRMKAAEKDEVLECFRMGQVDVLVSTTVIEVGVNVPNATIMVVENAERFGLAQLHQLRGRVGRGSEESWCFLMAEPNERLRFLSRTNDGFLVAQKDMELRGPGELFGTRQSGAVAEGAMLMNSGTELLKETHDLAHSLIHRRDTLEAQIVLRMAHERYAKRLNEIGVN